MWEPQRLTTLWASTASYRDSFTFNLKLSHNSCFSHSLQIIIHIINLFDTVARSY
jgi:hypothetical protein